MVVSQPRTLGVAPERTLNEDDIAAYGVSNVGQLVDDITKENGESAGEPLLLVDGKPIANQNDITGYPAEALARVEILPRGAATKVGGSPNRRVYNFKLKRKANIVIVRTATRVATDGGWHSNLEELSYTKIDGDRRFNGALTLNNETPLLESERGVTEPPGSPPPLANNRTLEPRIGSYPLTLSGADRLAPWLTGSLTGKLAWNTQDSLVGLDRAGDPLQQHGETLTGNADLALNADIGSWLVSLLGSDQ